jgi:hypothetical protein
MVSLPLSYAEKATISLINTVGQTVLMHDVQDASTEIRMDVSAISKGFYHCIIDVTGEGRVVKKLIID